MMRRRLWLSWRLWSRRSCWALGRARHQLPPSLAALLPRRLVVRRNLLGLVAGFIAKRGCSMKLEGKDGVVTHFLMDVDNRLEKHTFVSYSDKLGVLCRLLREMFDIVDLEQVEIKHLRACVQRII